MLKYLIFLVAILSVPSWGQSSKKLALDTGLEESEQNLEKIIIHPFISPFIPLYDQEYINRVATKIVARQEKYYVLISKDIDAQTKLRGVYSLKIDVSKRSSKDLRLEVKIVDNNKKLIVKRVIKEEFPPEDFKAVAEVALMILFGLEPEYDEGIKDRQKKKKDPNDEVVAKEDERTIDFRKRILALKQGLKQEFKIVESKKKEEKEAEGENKTKEEPKKTQSAPPAKKTPPLESVYAPRGPQKVPGIHNFFTWYSLGFSASNFIVKDRAGTDIEVLLRTKLNSLLANIYTEIWPPYFDQHSYYLRFGANIPMFYTEEIQPEASPELDLGLMGAYFGEHFYWRLGIRRDRQSFANLPELGGGIQLAKVDVTWTLASVHVLFWNRNIYLKYEQASQLMSEFEDVEFTDGSLVIRRSTARLGFSSSFLVKGSYIELASQSTEFQATGERDIVGSDATTFLMWQLTF